MTCWANQHTFTWSSTTLGTRMPLSHRCECGLLSQGDVDPVRRLGEALAAAEERERELRAALEEADQAINGADIDYVIRNTAEIIRAALAAVTSEAGATGEGTD